MVKPEVKQRHLAAVAICPSVLQELSQEAQLKVWHMGGHPKLTAIMKILDQESHIQPCLLSLYF